MGTLSDRLKDELENLKLQSKQLDERYKASKTAVEARIETLKQLQPLVTKEVERLVTALGLQI